MKLSLLLFILSLSQQALAKEWAFDVYLDKNKIGTHDFTLNDNNQLLSKARFNVKVLFINAYNYLHTAKEQWQSNCLESLEANTVENKVTTNVYGSQNDRAFKVSNGQQAQQLPACVMTFAYWNPEILNQTQLLNPQNAEFLDTKIEKLGSEPLQVRGKAIETQRYKIKGDLNGKNKLSIELWYDLQGNWVGLKSLTPEGYTINYKLK